MTLKKNYKIVKPHFQVYRDGYKRWRWRLVEAKDYVLCKGAPGAPSEAEARKDLQYVLKAMHAARDQPVEKV
jgi:hypothetical protein